MVREREEQLHYINIYYTLRRSEYMSCELTQSYLKQMCCTL